MENSSCFSPLIRDTLALASKARPIERTGNMITCYASIAPALANAKSFGEFAAVTAESIVLDYARDGKSLYNAVCGDVWRECKRNSNKLAWSTFKRRANEYCRRLEEIPRDAKITFVLAGEIM